MQPAVDVSENAHPRSVYLHLVALNLKKMTNSTSTVRENLQKNINNSKIKNTDIKKMTTDREMHTKQFLRNSKMDCYFHDNILYACTHSFNRFLNLALACSSGNTR